MEVLLGLKSSSKTSLLLKPVVNEIALYQKLKNFNTYSLHLLDLVLLSHGMQEYLSSNSPSQLFIHKMCKDSISHFSK